MRNWLPPILLVVLAACADMPQQPAAATPPPRVPSITERSAPHKTLDPDEIRKRWGDLELYMQTVFVSKGNKGDDPEFTEYRWVIWGALARVDYLNCYEQTRKCDEGWYWIEYDAANSRLSYLNSSGAAFSHGLVQPDGSVSVTKTNGYQYRVGFDYDRDEGLNRFPSGPTRHTPADRKQYAEIRKQWKEVDAQARADERQANAAAEAERAAQRRADKRRDDEQFAQNFNRALGAFGQAYSSSMQDYRRQQAQSAALNNRIAQSTPSTQAQRPTTSSSPQRLQPPRTNVESLRAPPQPPAPAVAVAPTSSAQRPAPVASEPSVPPAARPIKFRLFLAMEPGPKSRANPGCHSNVITLAAPPGYGHPGFDVNNGNAQQKARAIIEGYYSRFTALCNATANGATRLRSRSTPTFDWNASDASAPHPSTRNLVDDVTVQM